MTARLVRYAIISSLQVGCAPNPPSIPTATLTPTPTPIATATPTPTPIVDPRQVARLVRDGSDKLLLNKPADALPYLDEAYRLDPNNAEVHYWLFTAHAKIEPTPASREAKGPQHALRLLELETDHPSWQKEATDYLDGLPTASKSVLACAGAARDNIWSDQPIDLEPSIDQDLYGFCQGRTRNFIIKPQFHAARGFTEGLAAVQDRTGAWGFINPRGDWVIAPQFNFVGFFAEGVCNVQVRVERDQMSELGEKTSGSVSPQVVQLTGKFENYHSVEGGKWGYIDHSGNWVIKPLYESAQPFAKGRGQVGLKYEYPNWPKGFVTRDGALTRTK